MQHPPATLSEVPIEKSLSLLHSKVALNPTGDGAAYRVSVSQLLVASIDGTLARFSWER